MDRVDRQILRTLQSNGRLTNAELADTVHLTPSPCLRRVRQLEAQGAIVGYRAIIDGAAVGCGFQAFVTVVMRNEDHDTIADFERHLSELPEVIEAHRLFGEPDYLLRVATADTVSYEQLYANVLSALPGIARVTSLLAMKAVKRDAGYSIEEQRDPGDRRRA